MMAFFNLDARTVICVYVHQSSLSKYARMCFLFP